VSTTRGARLDALRVALIGGVVVFHSTRPFDPFNFYVKADTEVEPLALAVLFVGLWGMPLFLVLAGAAVWHSLGRRGGPVARPDRPHGRLDPGAVRPAAALPRRVRADGDAGGEPRPGA
jgi:peptidoglycan/LPS O-acetylase OafA/YrhL